MIKHTHKILKKINILTLLGDCLAGEASLFKAFWVVYIVFGLIQITIIELIFKHYFAGIYITFAYHNEITDKFVTIAFPYLFLSSMCVWTCGKNSWREWNIISKCVVVMPLILCAFHLTSIF